MIENQTALINPIVLENLTDNKQKVYNLTNWTDKCFMVKKFKKIELK